MRDLYLLQTEAMKDVEMKEVLPVWCPPGNLNYLLFLLGRLPWYNWWDIWDTKIAASWSASNALACKTDVFKWVFEIHKLVCKRVNMFGGFKQRITGLIWGLVRNTKSYFKVILKSSPSQQRVEVVEAVYLNYLVKLATRTCPDCLACSRKLLVSKVYR